MSCFVILGMHRSGTSCLTGTLQECGVELGSVHVKNPFNLRGNREHPLVMQLNDDVLEMNGGRWDQPTLATLWNSELTQRRTKVIEAIRGSEERAHWGFKDPRTLFTLPFWEGELPSDTVFIATFRHPVLVAQSLNKRNKFSLEQGIGIWKTYNRRLLDVMKMQSVALVNFDLEAESYRLSLLEKLARIGIPTSQDRVSGFFDPSLRNQLSGAAESEIDDPEAREIYSQLIGLSSE